MSKRCMQPGKIRLLKMVTNFNIGGTERQVTNLVLRLDRQRFDLHLTCLRCSGELLRELESLPVPKVEFPIAGFHTPQTFAQELRLARYIRQHSIQIVHSYGFYSNVFTVPAARLAGAPVVVASIRDTGDVLTPLQRQVQKAICRLADCVLVNAEAIREALVGQGYDATKIWVIRNGITLPKPTPGPSGGSLRQQLGLPPRSRLVAVFSRLNPMKGVSYFVESAAAIAKDWPDVYFLVVGDGQIKKELEEQAQRLGLGPRMVFTGFRDDVSAWLPQTAVSVLPSLSEGLSNTLLESMVAGVPVIATRVGGNPEVVEDGVTGLLVPPRDSATLAAAMRRLLQDDALASAIAQAAAQRVRRVFSIERSVRDTEELYLRLLEANGGS